MAQGRLLSALAPELVVTWELASRHLGSKLVEAQVHDQCHVSPPKLCPSISSDSIGGLTSEGDPVLVRDKRFTTPERM
jgi:hypothetical protein